MSRYEPLFGPGIIDAHAFIGNWPFRRLRHNDAPGLIQMMDTFGISKACVASADAILYRDSHDGNRMLHEQTRPHADRFFLYATLNPAYAGWQRDLRECVDLGFSALRLYPTYHGYALESLETLAIIDAATEAGLPVSFTGRIEDVRQRHWMDVIDNIDPESVLALAEQRPKTTFIMLEAILGYPRDSDIWKRMHALPFYAELTRMTSVLDKNIEIMLGALGPDRILLGTGFPFKTPSPAFLKLQCLNADAETKEHIAGGNAERLFSSKNSS
ncbi:MAG: amidohydrolase family protein [Candidatus Hydrogenedentes bacterium]|nr:amidohydrolase family protein [Candidatus Hydrogenedentota bacterium]